ncbi:MAG: lasso RiPP family leader peptide-containing protein [Gemmatimonadetes bacterium]|nr:lasso RiPP family leader peptide-containing protein [Gemmatimonadota bacterium]
MSHNRSEQGSPKVRTAYQAPVLRVHGTFQALTQTTTCAKGYNDGTATGCKNSFKKS